LDVWQFQESNLHAAVICVVTGTRFYFESMVLVQSTSTTHGTVLIIKYRGVRTLP